MYEIFHRVDNGREYLYELRVIGGLVRSSIIDYKKANFLVQFFMGRPPVPLRFP